MIIYLAYLKYIYFEATDWGTFVGVKLSIVWPLQNLFQQLMYVWTSEKYTFCFFFSVAVHTVLFLSDLKINKSEENIFKNWQLTTTTKQK